MRSDIDTGTQYKDRTHSEMVERQELGGYNLIKVAKYINLIVGVALMVIVVLEFIAFQFLNPFEFTKIFIR